MSHGNDNSGTRLASLAQAELAELRTQLDLARQGRDRAVHKARKTLQRLRAILRLLAPLDSDLAVRDNAFMRRFRHRLAPLRDAAARRQTLLLLATRPRWKAQREELRALAALEGERHAQAWAEHGPESRLWLGTDRDWTALSERVAAWPFAGCDEALLDRALTRAEVRCLQRIDAAAGAHGRELRHELRRKLRRYANQRRAAAQARHEEDKHGERLLDLAKRCGHEGDLWMALQTVRRVARTRPAFRPLARAMEAARQQLCQRHDRLLLKAGLS